MTDFSMYLCTAIHPSVRPSRHAYTQMHRHIDKETINCDVRKRGSGNLFWMECKRIARSPVSRFHSLITGSALALLYILRLHCRGLSGPWTTTQMVTTDAVSPFSHHGQCRDVLLSMVWKGTGLALRVEGPPRMKHRLCSGLSDPSLQASSKRWGKILAGKPAVDTKPAAL